MNYYVLRLEAGSHTFIAVKPKEATPSLDKAIEEAKLFVGGASGRRAIVVATRGEWSSKVVIESSLESERAAT